MMKLELKNISHGALKIKNEKGFTLLEVIVAISILTVGLLGVATMQTSSMRGNAFADDVTGATHWAADRLEKLIDAAYLDYDNHADLQDGNDNGEPGLDDVGVGAADGNDSQGIYSIYWNVAPDSLVDDTKTITVIVIWTNHGVQKKVTMQNIIPRIN